MKKILISCIILICLLVVVGFKEGNGEYKEGIYYGYAIDLSDGIENEVKAIIYVGEDGMIESVSLDTTYPIENNNLNVIQTSNSNQDWYEQIEILENKIIREQKISNDDDNTLYIALNKALNKAKKNNN